MKFEYVVADFILLFLAIAFFVTPDVDIKKQILNVFLMAITGIIAFYFTKTVPSKTAPTDKENL